MRAKTLLSIAFLTATALTAPVHNNGSLVFEDCPTALVPKNSSMKCGSIEVPMDWTGKSSTKKITIGVVKIPAKNPSKRIGPLFYNPGGPGEDVSLNLAAVVSGETPMHSDILDAFDIIGVDVRGTGLSSPITCSNELFNMPANFYPKTPEEFAAQMAQNQKFRQSCLNMTGSNLIDYMDTVSIVHDHEAVRQALGGEKLTWLGQSYGTLLASQYAELYAEYIRGMVLDGVVSASQAPTAEFVPDATSTEATMNRFFDFCSTSNEPYCVTLRRNATTPLTELWKDLIAKAIQSPVPAPRCKSGELPCPGDEANVYQLLEGTTQLLFPGEDVYPVLAAAVHAALFENDSSLLLTHVFQVPNGTSAYAASQAYGVSSKLSPNNHILIMC
jgi:pimeloyl-ACP methyl ester carboxylesterase